MNIRNYQKELDRLIGQIQKENKVPSLFLHSCCAPCSSYVLEYLSKYFDITVFYYNPNIYPEEEYRKRVQEITRLVNSMEFEHPVKLIEGRYDPQDWKTYRKEENAALDAIVSVWKKQQSWQRKVDMIISRPLCLSVR